MTAPILALTCTALLVGFLCGLRRSGASGRVTGRREPPERSQGPAGGRNRRLSASKLIALGVLLVDGSATYIVLYLCYLAVLRDYSGALPYLTTLIGALQAATGYILGHYFKKATVENTRGGITYDAALGKKSVEENTAPKKAVFNSDMDL